MTSLMDGENGSTNAPWWVGATLKAGVPAALAIYLVYYVTSGQGREALELRNDVKALTAVVSGHVTTTESSMHEIQRLLTVACANAAKDANDRKECFR